MKKRVPHSNLQEISADDHLSDALRGRAIIAVDR